MNAGPRVLVLASVLAQPMGGVRRHASQLLPRAARRLEALGGGLCLLEGREPLPEDLAPGVERLPSSVRPWPVLRRALDEPRAVREALDHARASGTPFDVVHTGHLPIPPRRALGSTALVTLRHDLRQLDPARVGQPRALIARRLHAAAAARSDRIVFVSEHVRDCFLARFGVDRERTAVVPDAGDHLAAPGPLPAELAPGFLLHVGHLEPRKNLGLLVEVLALDPDLPTLVLAGAARGDEGRRLQARARALGVEQRMRMIGEVQEPTLAALYRAASVVVVPSVLEGFGLAVEEARACGARVAVAATGALPEVAGPDVPRFDPRDARSALEALRRALAAAPPGPSTRRWDASADALVQVWRDACELSRARS